MSSPVPYGDSGKLLSQGAVASAYYFFGPVDVLKDEAVAGLLDRVLDPSLRDFNYDQRSATQLQAEDVESLTTTLPMMADRRVVVIRDVESWARKARAKSAVLRYLDRPIPETVLILIQGGADPEADAELVARATAIDFQPLTDAKAEKWVARRADQLGVVLEPAATRLLLNAVEGDLGWLAAELAKLTGLGGGAAVTVKQVEALMGVRHGETQFDWRDAVLMDEPARALAMLPHVLEQAGVSGVKLVSLLGASLVGLGAMRVMHDKGTRGRALASAGFDLLKRTRASVGPWGDTVSRWTSCAAAWPGPRVRAAVRAALVADQALKSTTISDERGILTDLVLTLAFARQEAA
ncbi:MAG TPA: DNA polymerase III subunit delta [Gemmatimonadales bacterium]